MLGLLLCSFLWCSLYVHSSLIDVLTAVPRKTIESLMNRYIKTISSSFIIVFVTSTFVLKRVGKRLNRIQQHNLGEDQGDKFIFTGEEVKTIEDLMQTIAILREQIKELKTNIYSNKNILASSKKDKDSIK